MLENYYSSIQTFLSIEQRRFNCLCFTNGCFDLLHAGHVSYLSKLRSMGDFLVVGLNSDISVTRLKGFTRPLQNERLRASVLCALRSVDAVIKFDEDTPLNLIKQLKPDILAKGGDYTIETIVGSDIVLGYGGKVVTIPFCVGLSTSSIVDRIRNGNVSC